jgi:hypothetical protein
MARHNRVGSHCTQIYQDPEGYTCIQYHSTIVVRFNAHTITLNTGRWYTATTKLRMNQTSNQFRLGYIVYQQNWKWYVNLPDGTTKHFDTSQITFNRVSS